MRFLTHAAWTWSGFSRMNFRSSMGSLRILGPSSQLQKPPEASHLPLAETVTNPPREVNLEARGVERPAHRRPPRERPDRPATRARAAPSTRSSLGRASRESQAAHQTAKTNGSPVQRDHWSARSRTGAQVARISSARSPITSTASARPSAHARTRIEGETWASRRTLDRAPSRQRLARPRIGIECQRPHLVGRAPEDQQHRIHRAERRDPGATDGFEALLAQQLDRRDEAGVHFSARKSSATPAGVAVMTATPGIAGEPVHQRPGVHVRDGREPRRPAPAGTGGALRHATRPGPGSR